MDKALRAIIISIVLFVAVAHGQILRPIMSTHPSGASFSQIRCTASQQFISQTTFTVNFPSCATAGDLLVIYFGTIVSGGNGGNNAPVAWSYSGGTFWSTCLNWCGGAYTKILTSTDVSAGSQAFPVIASGNGTATVIEFNGPTGGFTLGDISYTKSSNVATLSSTASVAPVADDTVLFFGGCGCTTAVSINTGTVLQQQTIGSGSGGANIASYTHYTSGAAAPTATTTMGTFGNGGTAVMTIVVHGVQWTPRSIPGLQAWYAADCITTSGTTCQTPSTGTHPTAWYNESTYTTSTVTGSTNVTFNTNQLNGLPAVTFASTGSFVTLALPTDSEWKTNPSVSFAGVWKNAGTSAKGELIGANSGGYAYWSCGSSIQQGMDRQQLAQLGTGTAACDTSWHQANAVFSFSTSVGFRINQATDTTQGASTGTSGIFPVALGRNNQTTSEYFNGQIAELMFYAHPLQSNEISLLESYLHTKYGL